jgi:hypothetical protein
MSTKSRDTLVTVKSAYAGNNGTQQRVVSACLGWQQIVSSSHPYWLLGKTDSDVGGPFTSTKWRGSGLPSPVSLQGDLTPSNAGWKSSGTLVPSQVDFLVGLGRFSSSAGISSGLVDSPDSKSQMEALGTTAIARCNPVSPVFDGATAVAELYSGIPGMPGGAFVNTRPSAYYRGNVLSEATRGGATAQGVADDYLNYQFAVAPTISDALALRRAAQESESIIAQLERDAGKTVRRSYEFPETTRSVVDGSYAFGPTYVGGLTPTAYEVGTSGTVRQTSTYTTSRRFTGAFTYHLPPKGSWRRKIAQLDAVYGIRPGIDTAWNLVPFSWMADWYGNMGDVLTNLQAFGADGNVLKYGYITSRTERTIRITGSCPIRRDGAMNTWSEYPFSWEMVFTTLQRYPANPFGFGVSGAALTPRRIAILAALGLGQV